MPLRLKEEAWFELYKAALNGTLAYPGDNGLSPEEWAKASVDDSEPIVAARCPSMIDVVRSAQKRPEKFEVGQWWVADLPSPCAGDGRMMRAPVCIESIDGDVAIVVVHADHYVVKIMDPTRLVTYLGQP